jgi:magnesium transporter
MDESEVVCGGMEARSGLTMVFSLYGMNFAYMPELQGKWRYPIVMAAIAFFSIMLHRRLRRVGWL